MATVQTIRRTAWLGRTGIVAAVGFLVVAALEWHLVGSVPAAVVCVLVSALIAQLHVRTDMSASEVMVRMFPFPARRIALEDIASIDIDDAHGRWRAVGLRWLGPQHWATISGGPEVTVHYADGSSFTFSYPDPHAFLERIVTR